MKVADIDLLRIKIILSNKLAMNMPIFIEDMPSLKTFTIFQTNKLKDFQAFSEEKTKNSKVIETC
jgi:hypothetical protein